MGVFHDFKIVQMVPNRAKHVYLILYCQVSTKLSNLRRISCSKNFNAQDQFGDTRHKELTRKVQMKHLHCLDQYSDEDKYSDGTSSNRLIFCLYP